MILLVVTGLAFGVRCIAYSRTTEFKPCPAWIANKDFLEERAAINDPLLMKVPLGHRNYRVGTPR
ncbi:MAG: hypothetical protein AB7R87_11560 [Parvibaculaceae bacterium]